MRRNRPAFLRARVAADRDTDSALGIGYPRPHSDILAVGSGSPPAAACLHSFGWFRAINRHGLRAIVVPAAILAVCTVRRPRLRQAFAGTPITVTIEPVRIARTGILVKRLGLDLGRELSAVAVAGRGRATGTLAA